MEPGSARTAFVGTSGSFVDAKTLPESGTYSIVVDPYGDAVGAMTLELYDVPADAAATIAPGGSPVSLATTVPGQNARATFNAPAGSRVSVRLSGVTIKTANVALMKGSTSLTSTIVGTSGGFLDVQPLTSAGEYALVVNPQTSYTGAITLTLYDVPADVGGSIAPDGSAATLALNVPGQNAKLGFDGLAGDRFVVKVGSGFPGSAYVSIVGPTGTVGGRTLVSSSGGLLDLRTLEASGRHELLVDPQGATTGSLTVNLYAVPPDPSLAILAGGPPVTVDHDRARAERARDVRGDRGPADQPAALERVVRECLRVGARARRLGVRQERARRHRWSLRRREASALERDVRDRRRPDRRQHRLADARAARRACRMSQASSSPAHRRSRSRSRRPGRTPA